MFQTIMRAFVPGYGQRDDAQVREKSGKVAGAIGIATNLLLFAIKMAAGLPGIGYDLINRQLVDTAGLVQVPLFFFHSRASPPFLLVFPPILPCPHWRIPAESVVWRRIFPGFFPKFPPVQV